MTKVKVVKTITTYVDVDTERGDVEFLVWDLNRSGHLDDLGYDTTEDISIEVVS